MSVRTNGGAYSAAHIAEILDTIDKRDGVVRSYCQVLSDEARASAETLDLLPPERRGYLHGLGIGIKEVFDVAGGLCAWGTDIHAGRRPRQDAVIVQALRRAGGVILGTTTSTEYAMARMAPTTNPFDPDRTPGASSSGSAAAVAAGMADIAIGSQTIGSGIRPASYCGVFGYKPTQGAFSLEGAMPLSNILDHPVIFANEMSLIARSFKTFMQSEAVLANSGLLESALAPVGSGAKIALVTPWFEDDYSPDLWEMVSSFARSIPNCDCFTVSLPEQIGAREEACLTSILSADMWRHHANDYHQHADKMSRGLITWLERGRDINPEDYRAALNLRVDLLADVANAVADYDFAITLATTDTAPLRSEGTGSRAPQRLWNLVGYPAICGPIGNIEGMPVGVQLIARAGADAALLDFAAHAFRNVSGTKVGAGL